MADETGDRSAPPQDSHKVRFQSSTDDSTESGSQTSKSAPNRTVTSQTGHKLYNVVGKPFERIAECNCVNSAFVVNGCICILFCLVIAAALSTILTFRCFQDVAELKTQNENLTSLVEKLKTENEYLKSMLEDFRSKDGAYIHYQFNVSGG